MKSFIDYCISKTGSKYIAHRNLVESDTFNYYVVIYKDIYDSYRKLELFLNETDVFCPSSNRPSQVLIGDGCTINSLEDKIQNSIQTFDSIEECKLNTLKNITPNKLNRIFDRMNKVIINNILDLYIESIKVRSVHVYLKPTAICIIEYIVDGEYRPPLKCFLGSSISTESYMNNSDIEFIEEVEKIINSSFSRL